MPAAKGTRPPAAGIGRKKGSKNKATVEARRAMELAFQGIGGVKTLTQWANDNLTEFFKLYGRLIPAEQKHEVSGEIRSVVVIPALDK